MVSKKIPWIEPIFIFVLFCLGSYYLAAGCYYIFQNFIAVNYELIRLIDIGVAIAITAMLWIYCRMRKFSFSDIGIFSFKLILICSLVAVLTRIIIDPITWQEYIFNSKNEFPSAIRNLNNTQLFLQFIYLVVCIPVLEEIVFRFIIQNKFSVSYGSFIGLLGSTLLFSIIHINFTYPNIISIEFSIILGLILGLVYQRSGLVAAIITHASYNLVNWMISYNKPFYYNVIESLNFDWKYWFMILGALLAIILLILKWPKMLFYYKKN